MGARIEAASALTSRGLRKPSARRLADAAARTCLAQAGREPGDIDMLINAGIYREDNMGEPALAADRAGGHRGQPGSAPVGGHGTFSFDLLNGTCGVISAIQVQAGMLRSGVIRLGAIVTSDVHPDLEDPRSAPSGRPAARCSSAGTTALAGFTDFHSETFPEYEDLFVSGLVWQGRRRQSQMVIDSKPGYHARLVDCAEEATRRFLHGLGMDISEIDLLVPAPSSPDFLDRLRARLGVPATGSRMSQKTSRVAIPPGPSPRCRRPSSPAGSAKRATP